MTDRQIDRQTNRHTDTGGHRDVSLPIRKWVNLNLYVISCIMLSFTLGALGPSVNLLLLIVCSSSVNVNKNPLTISLFGEMPALNKCVGGEGWV